MGTVNTWSGTRQQVKLGILAHVLGPLRGILPLASSAARRVQHISALSGPQLGLDEFDEERDERTPGAAAT